MDQNFQTSFMPKKPMIEERVVTSRPIGVVAILALFVFLAVLLATGALYFYKSTINRGIVKMENDLNLAKSRFEPSKIVQLQVLDKRLRASGEILGGHVAVTPVFKMLEDMTMKTVRYTKFDYVLGEARDSRIKFKMTGQAVGYRSIALQSDLFTKNKQLLDPVFSNLSLDDKGNVIFELNFSVDPALVDYKTMLKSETEISNPVINDSNNLNTPN